MLTTLKNYTIMLIYIDYSAIRIGTLGQNNFEIIKN